MAESAQFEFDRPPRRKVWVVNLHPSKDYQEEYRGENLVIRKGQEKHLLMDLVAAEKFLSKPALPYYTAPDNVTELSMGKPLKIVELEPEEVKKHDPKNYVYEKSEDERELKALCTVCGEQLPTMKGLTLHLKHKHPDYSPVKEL